jgi:RHS repeat-associated protein
LLTTFTAGALAMLTLSAAARAQSSPSAALGPSSLKLPSGPGSVAGLADPATIDVFSAQVGYSIPIELPAAGGLAPTLSLDYSGSLGNGIVGVGWHLGLGAIRRSTREGIPGYGDADDLILEGIGGGGRLVPIGGIEYRIEGNGNAIRVRRTSAGFQITDSDGTVYSLGATANERLEQNGRAAAWFVSTVGDLKGNTLRFRYTRSNAQVYLDRVNWGPDGAYQLKCEYEQRQDPVVSYVTGFRVETNLRLANLRVSNGEELKRYGLLYDGRTRMSRLLQVRVTGRRGEGELPVVTLAYSDGEAESVEPLAGTGGWALDTRGVTFSDVDGDGVDDLLRLEMGNHEWRKNVGGKFLEPRPLFGASAISLESSRLVDLDGDARPELVRVIDDQWQFYRLEGDHWTAGGTWAGTRNVPLAARPGVVVADLNGDGRADVVEAVTGGMRIHRAAAAGLGPAFYVGPISSADPSVELSSPGVKMLDWNGDSIADVVWMTDSWMKVFLGCGDGTFETFGRVAYPWGGGALDTRTVRFADLDRDGLIDLVRFVGGNVLFYHGKGNHAFEATARHVPRPESTDFDAIVTFADANGNGSADIVWSSPRGIWALDLAGATNAGMLASIDNGLGLLSVFSYESSGLLSIGAELAGRPWQKNLPTSIPVPIQMEARLADGQPSRYVHYGVRDGFWDGEERRFGGFLEGRTVVAGPGGGAGTRVEITHYLAGEGQDRELRGKPVSVITQNGLGQVFKQSETSWETRCDGSLPCVPALRCAVSTQSSTTLFENVATPIRTRSTTIFDSECRPVEQNDEGRLDVTGDERFGTKTYASNERLWVRDRIVAERLLSSSGTVLSQTRYFFGDETTTVPVFGDVAKGWPVGTQSWLADASGGGRWVPVASLRYDRHGNMIYSNNGGMQRNVFWTDDGLYPIRETMTPRAGLTLTWNLDWDRVTGQALSMTDPNGDVTSTAYDSLLRPIAQSQNGQPPHIRYVYNWSSPRPSTVTYSYDGLPSELASRAGQFANGPPWRQIVEVNDSAGAALYSATRMSPTRWLISGWQDRDVRGRAVASTEPFYWDAAALPIAHPAGVMSKVLNRYDAMDRLVEQTLANGAHSSVRYVGLCKETRRDDLAPTLTCDDGLGRPVHTERTIDGVTEFANARYDAAGRMTNICFQGDCQSASLQHVFQYDTMGRLRSATDPDIGLRSMQYDDAGHLVSHINGTNQSVSFTYDDSGRLVRRSAPDGTFYAYHYDENFGGGSSGHVLGRLGWVEEPTGRFEIYYDEFGRPIRTSRTIDGVTATKTLTVATSGTLLRELDDDGFALDYAYDPAGRLQTLGTLWRATNIDAAGRIVDERFGNGLTTHLDYDDQGNSRRVTLSRQSTPLYDVELVRNSYGGVTQSIDHDGRGLDQNATFAYDGAARLIGSTMGTGTGKFAFSYQYDALQNMIVRTASGPRQLGALVGTYVYGENGKGPRQLTSVRASATLAVPLQSSGGKNASAAAAAAAVQPAVTSFVYDGAGRETSDGTSTMTYNAMDQLTRVTAGATTTDYAYGFDGEQIKTRTPSGAVEYWFSPDVHARLGGREHYVLLGGRLLARVTLKPPATAPAPAAVVGSRPVARTMLVMLFLVLGILVLWPRRTRAYSHGLATVASLLVLAVMAPACGTLLGEQQSAVWNITDTVYFHTGFGAGPVLLTRVDGSVLEERRHEPFGTPIDSYGENAGGGGGTVRAVDYAIDPMNSLSKPTDPTTGWSYHGARWMSPQTARWLTPDPPVKGPDPGQMATPWKLHPYQYVTQNPVGKWDPTGSFDEDVHGAVTYYLLLAAGFSVHDAAVIALFTAAPDHWKETIPTNKENIGSGMTHALHFDGDRALEGVSGQMRKGSGMSLSVLGLYLHGLEDMGTQYDGPHMGFSRFGASLYAIYCGARSKAARDVGHPWSITEKGSLSTPLRHTNDHAYENPRRYGALFRDLYSMFQGVAQAYYQVSRPVDDKLANEIIRRSVTSTNREAIMNNVVDYHPILSDGTVAPSYFDIVTAYSKDMSNLDGTPGKAWTIDVADDPPAHVTRPPKPTARYE